VSVSDDYSELTTPEAIAQARALADAWKDPSIPAQQRDLADRELAAWRTGAECPPFDAFAWALDAIVRATPYTHLALPRVPLLDIGCGSGYYSEVIDHWDAGLFSYHGVDYSPTMIDIARARYAGNPLVSFDVADALALPCADRAFDVVVSGCYLLHLTDDRWRDAIREAVRVSRRWVVFHRTPLLYAGPTRYFTKRAYGVPCLEIHFSVSEFRAALADADLRVRFERQIARTGEHANETWVCERMTA